MGDPVGEILGESDRSHGLGGWDVPDVIDLDAGRLLWRLERVAAQATASREQLFDFVNLEHADDDAIARFASRHGVLFGFGYTRCLASERGRWGNFGGPVLPECTGCGPTLDAWGEGWEPVHAWRMVAGQAAALMRLRGAIREGGYGDLDDWTQVGVPARLRQGTDVVLAERLVYRVLNGWLALSPVSPAVAKWSPRAVVELVPRGLFGAVALALTQHVVGGGGWAMCSECDAFYAPRRRPRADQAHYCEACRNRGRWRRADEKRRAGVAKG